MRFLPIRSLHRLFLYHTKKCVKNRRFHRINQMGSAISSNNFTICRSLHTTENVNSMEDPSNDFIDVCNLDEVPENSLKSFDVEGEKVLLAKHNGGLYAIGDKCSHYGAPLANGSLCNGKVRCPWHGACFDLQTGDIEDFPGLDSIPKYEVFENNGKVKIKASSSSLQIKKRAKPMVKRDIKNTTKFVIVGGGAAGGKCVETLRQEGFTGELVLVTEESHLPYDRPKLTKAMALSSDKIALRNQKFYQDADIDIQTNSKVTKINPESKLLMLENGDSLQYDKVFLATGGSPRLLNCPGNDLNGIYAIRRPEDSNKVAETAKDKNVVVIGASFIGMEVASFLSVENRCSSVTVINNLSVPFERSLGVDVGERVQRLFEENGVKFINKSHVVEVIGEEGNVTGVKFDNGESLTCNLIVLGIGVFPTTQFLKESDINLNERGFVQVDKCLKTSNDNVYCGGDIAAFPLFLENDSHVSIGHWQVAHKHGHVAALNMIGKHEEIHSVPFFWTVLYGKSIRYTGYGAFDDVIISGDLENLSFVAYYCREDTVVALASLMKDPAAAKYADILLTGKSLTKTEVLENGDAIFNVAIN